jgi:hypothetical protein
MAISNIFIEDLLRGNEFFRGVFSADEKVHKLRDNESIIFNLSYRNEIGTHFIAICKKKNKIIVFDPLNHFFIIPQSIKHFIRKHNVKMETNLHAIQSYSSDYCGYFCIAFVLLCNSLSMREFLNLFHSNKNLLILNDVIVLKIINKTLKK